MEKALSDYLDYIDQYNHSLEEHYQSICFYRFEAFKTGNGFINAV